MILPVGSTRALSSTQGALGVSVRVLQLVEGLVDGWGSRGYMLLGGSGDLVSRVISKVTILISTYNPN